MLLDNLKVFSEFRLSEHGRPGVGHAAAPGGTAAPVSREAARTGETSAQEGKRVIHLGSYLFSDCP